jgi:hypothetical protein
LKLYNFGETLLGCITPDLAEGHTPGHPILKIFSENELLTHIVDTIHTTLLLSYPEWDVDFHKGVETRKRIIEEQVMSKGLTMSCHLPWPGLGYITRKGKGYNWIRNANFYTIFITKNLFSLQGAMRYNYCLLRVSKLLSLAPLFLLIH